MPAVTFNLNSGGIRPGDIIECRTESRWSRLICYALDSSFSHDAMIVQYNGRICVGDSKMPRSTATERWVYEAAMTNGTMRCRTIRPLRATEVTGNLAAHWWICNVMDRLYDVFAYPRLIAKCIAKWIVNLPDLPEWLERLGIGPAGAEWAWYCTEGCRDAWLHGGGYDPWLHKESPTPGTTERRVNQGLFVMIPGLLIDGVPASDSGVAR